MFFYIIFIFLFYSFIIYYFYYYFIIISGVRAYWDGKDFVSRNGNVFNAPDWFTESFPSDQTLDGELFGGRKNFNSTVSIVKVNKKKNK